MPRCAMGENMETGFLEEGGDEGPGDWEQLKPEDIGSNIKTNEMKQDNKK